MAQYHFPPVDLLNESKEYSAFTDIRYVGALKQKMADMFSAFKMDAVTGSVTAGSMAAGSVR